jgi:hypothetical protein
VLQDLLQDFRSVGRCAASFSQSVLLVHVFCQWPRCSWASKMATFARQSRTCGSVEHLPLYACMSTHTCHSRCEHCTRHDESCPAAFFRVPPLHCCQAAAGLSYSTCLSVSSEVLLVFHLTWPTFCAGVNGSVTISHCKIRRQDFVITNKRDERLQCSYWEPNDPVLTANPLPAVIYCHCNSGSRLDAAEAIGIVLPMGVRVFCLDFSVRPRAVAYSCERRKLWRRL